MKRIDEVFSLHRGRSDVFTRYEPGDVPYVGNGLTDNAVLGLVKSKPIDKVFDFKGIAVSAFCEATVQVPPFIACGRAGNGLVVLKPRTAMSVAQLAYFAAYINTAVRWRFSWYWQTTQSRLTRILVPASAPTTVAFDVESYIPTLSTVTTKPAAMNFQPFVLGAIYDLRPGDHHSLSALPAGSVPVVSCGDADNGISGYYGVEKPLYRNRLTVAFNGMNTLTAKYHPYEFAAKDDVAICIPKRPLRLTTELFIQVMLNRERWRFSYYRKCYREKLERLAVLLPVKAGVIDEDGIQELMKATPYWAFLKDRLGSRAAP